MKEIAEKTNHTFESLPDQELLRFIMPKQAAESLVAEYSSLYEGVMNAPERELAHLAGMNRTHIHKMNCLRELMKRFQQERRQEITVIRSPDNVAAYLNDMQYLQQEQFRIILLNVKNKVLGQKIISQGTINGALVSAREIFSWAIRNMAATIILAHNHPSGNSEPSSEDIAITKNLVEVGKVVDIKVADHVIIGKNQYYSFRQSGGIE